MDQVFLKKKNMSPIRFAPLYIFDTKDEIIKIINYIHVIKKLVVVISKLLTLLYKYLKRIAFWFTFLKLLGIILYNTMRDWVTSMVAYVIILKQCSHI